MVSTMVQYVVVWFGKTLAWHPIQLLWHGGVLCPEWWEEEEEGRGGREGGTHPDMDRGGHEGFCVGTLQLRDLLSPLVQCMYIYMQHTRHERKFA